MAINACWQYAGVLLLLFEVGSFGFGHPQDGRTYRSAAVEYNPIRAKNPYEVLTKEAAQQIMLTNLANYEGYMKNASIAGVQIIVFPEYGLYSPLLVARKNAFPYMEIIPDPSKVEVNPCVDWQYNTNKQEENKVTYTASCLSKRYNMVLVLNMGDLVPCNVTGSKSRDCPSDGHWMYNTQVAFDENGKLLAKYHKTHLYYEPEFNTPAVPESIYFDTSFGVRFGMMICFDILFAAPTNQLLTRGIQHFVFSTWWVNLFDTELLLTATQMQHAWATTFNVNMIAAGAGTGQFNSGSGIYSGKTILESFYNPVLFSPQNKMLIADLPKMVKSSTNTKYGTEVIPTRTPLEKIERTVKNEMLLIGPGQTDHVTIQSEFVTCSFEYTTGSASTPAEKFSLVVADGNITHWLFPIVGCGLVHSSPVLQSDLQFTEFKLTVQFSETAPIFYAVFPCWLSDQGQIFNTDLVFASDLTNRSYSVTATNYTNSLVNVEIFGRY